jgi:hypothetical protein
MPLSIPGHDTIEITWTVSVASQANLNNSNRLSLSVDLKERSVERDVPVIVVGSKALRVSGPYPITDEDPLNAPFGPEIADVEWTTLYARENSIPIENLLSEPGIAYVQAFFHTDAERSSRVGVPATCPTKLWVNGEVVLTCETARRLRPNYDGDGTSYVDVPFKAGWNKIQIKFARTADDASFDAHLILCDPGWLKTAFIDMTWTRIPE